MFVGFLTMKVFTWISLLVGLLFAQRCRGLHHIMLVVVDDVGYTDHELYFPLGDNGTDIPTPGLKKLAKDSILLTNYYTQTVCSPTRSALLTGLYPFRTGMQHSTTLMPGTTAHLPLEVPLLPEMLKLKGYKTHMLGKWHLGYAKWKYTPYGRGFDEWSGYLQGQEDYIDKTVGLNKIVSGYDFWHNNKVDHSVKGNYSLDQYMERYESMLTEYNQTFPDADAKLKNPFFLYFAHQTVHVPLESRTDEPECKHIVNKWRNIYCSMIVEVDRAIASTVDLLKKYAMWDDTLLLFTTDNGGMVLWGSDDEGTPDWPASVGSNWPYRGSKSTLFEGGVRATGMIGGGKNVIRDDSKRGTTYDGLMHAVDFFSMCIGAADATLYKDEKTVDGMNLLPSIIGSIEHNKNKTLMLPTRNDIPLNINYGGKKYTAIRFGKYKLIIGTPILIPNSGYWYPTGAGAPVKPEDDKTYPYYLYDLEADPYEKTNLASSVEHKELVKYGEDLLQKYMATGYRKPQTNLVHPLSFPKLHDGAWAPFLHDDHLELEESILSDHHHQLETLELDSPSESFIQSID